MLPHENWAMVGVLVVLVGVLILVSKFCTSDETEGQVMLLHVLCVEGLDLDGHDLT